MDKHKTSEGTRGLAKVLLTPDDLGRPLFGPAGVPAGRVKVLRDAFMKMMNDPDVLAEARKKGLEPSPVSGEVMTQPPEVIQRVKKLMEK